MGGLRIAVADDSQRILKKFEQSLKEIPEVEVAFTAESTDDFFNKYEQNQDVDALILDIEMDTPDAGLQIAGELCKPVLFTSSYASKYLKEIVLLEEKVGIAKPMPKDLVIDPDKFRQTIIRFCKEISRWKMGKGEMKLKTASGVFKTINVNDIVLISAEKDADNDKIVYFAEDEPITLPRTSFAKIAEWNEQYNQLFQRIHKQYVVNRNRIQSRSNDEVVVCGHLKDEKGQLKRGLLKRIPVTENYRKNLK